MIERQLVLELYHLRHMFTRTSLVDFSSGMLKSEFFVLQLLLDDKSGDRLTVSEIADRMGLSNPAISRNIKGLGEKKWIQRHEEPGDRRAAYISISSQGSTQYEQAFEQIVEQLRCVLKELDETRIKSFIQTGQEIMSAIKSAKIASQTTIKHKK